MTEIRWRRRFAAPAHVAWEHLTVPEKMCEWSKAPIARVDEGDGGRPDGVGALRKVTMSALGRRTTFEEIVLASEAPHRFVYHVVRGLPVRDHQGVILLRDDGSSCELDWHVRFEPLAAPLGPAAARMLDAQMGASLDTLETLLASAPVAPSRSRGPSFADDEAAVPDLLAAGEAILAEQRALADSLRADPKYWFSRVYAHVTEQQLRFVRERAAHPAWVLRLLPVFHRFYASNLEAHRAGRRPELPWRTAFRVMERARERDGAAVVRGLLLGVRAHIEEDLPRALAEVWLDHYRGRCDFVRLRGDYLRMGDVFREASARLVAEMPRGWLPPHLRLLGAVAPAEVQDWAFSRYYDVDRARRRAFERGRGLAGWLAARLTPS